MIRWYERLAAALKEKKVSRRMLGLELGLTSSAVTLKLQGKRPVSVEELEVLARLAGLTVAEVLGEDVEWLIELSDERDVIRLYRLLSDEQKKAFLMMLRASAAQIEGEPA